MLKNLYPPDWAELSERIRFGRALGRCECSGICGVAHTGGRCPAQHFDLTWFDPFVQRHVFWQPDGEAGGERRIAAEHWLLDARTEVKTIYLSTAHLWRGECAACHARGEKCAIESHLLAMCMGCHLLYDLPHHVETRRRTLAATFDRQRGLFEFLNLEPNTQ